MKQVAIEPDVVTGILGEGYHPPFAAFAEQGNMGGLTVKEHIAYFKGKKFRHPGSRLIEQDHEQAVPDAFP